MRNGVTHMSFFRWGSSNIRRMPATLHKSRNADAGRRLEVSTLSAVSSGCQNFGCVVFAGYFDRALQEIQTVSFFFYVYNIIKCIL